MKIAHGLFVYGACSALAVGMMAGCSRGGKSSGEERPPAYVRQTVPDAENAYPLWTNAVALAAFTSHDDWRMRGLFNVVCSFKTNMPDGVEGQSLAEMLASRRAMFGLVSEALALGRMQFPAPKGIHEVGSGLMSGWVSLANWMILDGRWGEADGDYLRAVRAYGGVCGMGRQMMAGEGNNIAYLIGSGLRMRGVSALRRLCAGDGPDADAMRHALTQIPEAPAEDICLAQTYRIEAGLIPSEDVVRRGHRTFGEWLASRLCGFKWVYDPAATATLFDRAYATYATNAMCTTWAACDRRLCAEIKNRMNVSGLDDMDDGLRDWVVWLRLAKASRKEPNIVGVILSGWRLESADSMLKNSFKTRTLVGLARAFIALRITRKETGAYPVSLDAAVAAGLLAGEPKDFFSGQPIRYSAERRLLWSVGEDGKDDDGDKRRDLILALPE